MLQVGGRPTELFKDAFRVSLINTLLQRGDRALLALVEPLQWLLGLWAC